MMTLIVSYTRLIERIMRFESWQPLIKYAAELNKADDREDLRRLYAFGLALDVAAAVAAALTAALLPVPPGSLFLFKSDSIGLILLSFLSLVLSLPVLPTSFFLLSGRFFPLSFSHFLSFLIIFFFVF